MGTNGILGITTVNLLDARIVAGPSRDRMFDLLKLQSELKDATATFEVDVLGHGRMTLHGTITAIENEGGAPHWFLNIGFAEVRDQLRFQPRLTQYHVFYDTRTRTGRIITGASIALMIHVSNDGEVTYNGETIANITW